MVMSHDTDILRDRRNELGITQAGLAAVLGLHTSAITRVESGRVDCKVSTINKFRDGLRIISDNRMQQVTGAIITDKTSFKNAVFKSVLQEFEGLERNKRYLGNGHHLAQRVSEMVCKGMNETYENQVSDTLRRM